MNPKILKLRGELEKNKEKISGLQSRCRELEKQIRELEDTDRNLFVGRYFHAYEVQRMAEAYGLTPNAASLRLYKTREKLRVYLNERGYHV